MNRAVLRRLPQRDAAIVAYRFGINDGQMHTLMETASGFGVDDEAIRRCESTVLAALRAARGGRPDLSG